MTTKCIVCNGLRACAVFWLASASLNQNQARLKYRYYLQFPTCEFHNFHFCWLYKFYFAGRLSQIQAIYLQTPMLKSSVNNITWKVVHTPFVMRTWVIHTLPVHLFSWTLNLQLTFAFFIFFMTFPKSSRSVRPFVCVILLLASPLPSSWPPSSLTSSSLELSYKP